MPVTSINGLVDDEWLSEQLALPAYRITDAWSSEHGLPSGHAFIYAKTPTTAIDRCHELEDAGFRWVDTLVTFEKARQPVQASDSAIRPAQEADEEAVARMAAQTFRQSRFHRDPAIGAARANAIKAAWARGYFHGTRGDVCLVAERNGVVAGFLIGIAAHGIVTADLMAVDPAHQRQGIACALMLALESAYPEGSRFRVGTQLDNLPTLRLYPALGYRIVESQHVFHLHRSSV